MARSTEQMRDHWWWRPGWRVGRSAYTWHITFAKQPRVQELARHYADLVGRFTTLDPVSISGLHLTVQGVGFTDEVAPDDLEKIAVAARTRCGQVQPIDATVGPATMDAEGVFLPVQPTESVALLKRTLREAIGDVWGQDNVPESMDGFHAHITLAYSNATGPAEPIRAAIAEHDPASAQVTLTDVFLIDLNRDAKRYEWDEVAVVALGQ